MIYFHKILPLIASPIFLVMILITWGIVFKSRISGVLAVSILIICSLPIFSNKLITYLENEYILSDASSAKTADAIVVLSGMVRTINGKNRLFYEWGEASDRIFAGIELIKKNKAPIMILTGGKLPWSVGKPEGEYLRDVVIKYGVPNKNIILTENVENTDQEAKAVTELLNKTSPKIILVTSAFHMPRAQKVFEAAGIIVEPFAVDFLSGADKYTIMNFIPSAGALNQTSFFIRELIGRLYYNLKY
ncbi:YdcF family protein [Amylibacter sp.]|nr:YdcF family protein [Amylibacter sp.]MDC1246296.1 YdcF family protein [Amylibacter sp.]